MKKKRVTRPIADKKPAQRQPKDFPPNWELRFKELKAFKDEYGHCNVPRNYPLNRPLANWIDSIRRRKKQGKLSPETIRQLNELGICWTLLSNVRKITSKYAAHAVCGNAVNWRITTSKSGSYFSVDP